jgi:hypothetical protein
MAPADILRQLQDPSISSNSKDSPVDLELPSAQALERILSTDDPKLSQKIKYSVIGVPHAMQQASSLAKVLSYPLIAQEPSLCSMSTLRDHGPWLIDSWLHLRTVQKRWAHVASNPLAPFITMASELVGASDANTSELTSFQSKACIFLILLCNELVSTPLDLIRDDTTGDLARNAYCMAVMTISPLCARSQSISRLATTQLVEELLMLSMSHPIVGTGTDTWVRLFPMLSDAHD